MRLEGDFAHKAGKTILATEGNGSRFYLMLDDENFATAPIQPGWGIANGSGKAVPDHQRGTELLARQREWQITWALFEGCGGEKTAA